MMLPHHDEYERIQCILDDHPEGILSRDLAQEFFGKSDRDTVSKVVARCERGRKLGILSLCRRRADLSTYAVWYPGDMKGVPKTYLENMILGMGEFSAFALRKKLKEESVSDPRFSDIHIRKAKTYLDLMVEDGTLEYAKVKGGSGTYYRWSYGN